jgi:hypothetical protein
MKGRRVTDEALETRYRCTREELAAIPVSFRMKWQRAFQQFREGSRNDPGPITQYKPKLVGMLTPEALQHVYRCSLVEFNAVPTRYRNKYRLAYNNWLASNRAEPPKPLPEWWADFRALQNTGMNPPISHVTPDGGNCPSEAGE